MRKSLLFTALLFFAFKLTAQDSLAYLNAPPLVIKALRGEITLDGKVDEAAWQQIPSFDFIMFRPDWGKPNDNTILKVAFDDRFLYVAAVLRDSAAAPVISRNLVRDGWNGDDFFTFHIDAAYSKQNASVFSIYPSGSRFDMTVANDAVELGNSTFNGTYDMLWEGKTHMLPDGWSLEMKIPLSNLRFREQNGKVYSAISSARTINDRNELYVFPAMPQEVNSSMMKPSIKQPVIFEGLKTRRQLLVTPYLLGGSNRSQSINSDQTAYDRRSDFTREVGLDIRYGLSSNITLDLTLNTDFAQVEADDQQINISRFSLFFPEKRRFFQEQAGLYEVGMGGTSQLFYSRNIGIFQGNLAPIIGGARLNGQLAKWEVGALSIQTQSTTSNGTNLPSENFSVARLRRKVLNNRSFIGFMGTHRSHSGYHNSAFATDAFLNIKGETYFVSTLAYSSDSEDQTSGFLNNIRFASELRRRVGEGWLYALNYNYSAPDFNPGMGFLGRQNFHNNFAQLQHGKYNQVGEGNFQYVKWTLLTSDKYWAASSGNFETWYNFSGWEATAFNGNSYDVSHIRELQQLEQPLRFSDKLEVPAGRYFFHYAFIGFYPAAQRKFGHRARLEAGSFYGGRRVTLTYSPSFNLNENINLSARWRANYIDLTRVGSGKEWLHVGQVKLEAALNLHLSGSFTWQYNSNSKTIFNNARIRYNFRDGHDLYLVYNENFNTQLEREVPILPRSSQQVFLLKYVYTFFR